MCVRISPAKSRVRCSFSSDCLYVTSVNWEVEKRLRVPVEEGYGDESAAYPRVLGSRHDGRSLSPFPHQASYTLTPLHLAAGKNYGKPARQLILLANKSGEIDIPDILGRSPLFYAARSMNQEFITALLQYGASPHLLDYAGLICGL